MRYAKAMYLGGQYLPAEQCDYDSAKTYGLVCPCCSSAVFLRGHGMRLNTLRNGKKKLQIINPYFAHYPTGIDDFNCELRSPTTFSEQVIRLAEIEARGQRLKLYNKHLIAMYDQDRNSSSVKSFTRDKAYKSIFTKTWKERLIRDTRLAVSQDPEMLQIDKDALIDFATTPLQEKVALLQKSDMVEFLGQVIEEDKLLIDYFSRHNLNLHIAIAEEIIEFTFTRTGGYFLFHLLDIMLWLAVFFVGRKEELVMRRLRSLIKPNFFVNFVLHTVQQTRWLDVLPLFCKNIQLETAGAAPCTRRVRAGTNIVSKSPFGVCTSLRH